MRPVFSIWATVGKKRILFRELLIKTEFREKGEIKEFKCGDSELFQEYGQEALERKQEVKIQGEWKSPYTVKLKSFQRRERLTRDLLWYNPTSMTQVVVLLQESEETDEPQQKSKGQV